jgi:hypothetical protein
MVAEQQTAGLFLDAEHVHGDSPAVEVVRGEKERFGEATAHTVGRATADRRCSHLAAALIGLRMLDN